MRLWRLPAGELAQTITTGGAIVHSVAFAPDGSQLVSAQRDGTIRTWSTDDGRAIRVIQAYERDLDVMSVRFSPDGTRIVAAAKDGRIAQWKADGTQGVTFRASRGGIWSIDISPDGRTLATGGADRNIRLWDISHR